MGKRCRPGCRCGKHRRRRRRHMYARRGMHGEGWKDIWNTVKRGARWLGKTHKKLQKSKDVSNALKWASRTGNILAGDTKLGRRITNAQVKASMLGYGAYPIGRPRGRWSRQYGYVR